LLSFLFDAVTSSKGIGTAFRFKPLVAVKQFSGKWSSHNFARRIELGDHFSNLVFPVTKTN